MSLSWNPHSLGGKARAVIQKREAEERYNNNPVICKSCGLSVSLRGRRPREVRRTQFCDHVCAAIFNNTFRRKSKPIKIKYCNRCGSVEVLKRRQFCNVCIMSTFANRSKKDVFNSRSNWQSARSSIRHHAVVTWLRAGNELKCSTCGYDKHAEVAHKKAVSEFSDNATIKEINAIDNLIALCPNHHWEFDNLPHDSETASCGSHTPEVSVQL